VGQQFAVHRAIMVVDVERFGDPARTNLNQLAIRQGMYEALTEAFAAAGIDWDSCVSEDRGDGALILIPPEIPKIRLVTSILGPLAAAIHRHNTESSAPERMRLRVALHAGEVYRDAHGVAGVAVNHAFRLAEAPALRSALAASCGVLALIVSDWLFTEVVRHDPAAVPGSYRRVQVLVKETAATGWVRVPDLAAVPASTDPGEVPGQDGTAVAVRSDTWPAGLGATGPVVLALRGPGLVVGDGGVNLRQLVPAQLPHDVLGFTGREPELAGLASLAAGQQGEAVVITAIDGVAGIGKTALAVHFAHRAAAAFPDGQLFVNLRGFDPGHPPLAPGEVLARFVRALGTDLSDLPADPDELAGIYRSQLSGRRVLVVLDNAVSAEQVRPLLPGTASCLAVITSRNRLSGLVAVDGAQRLTLDMLSPGQSVALLAQIAGDERVAADPAATRRLAELCGWLPLALRIAADRAAAHPHLGIADLAEELAAESDRLDVLATDEQTSQVRAVFSWSYRALAPGPARAFRLLGLHPGQDIGTDAAAALLAAPTPETRRLLRTLAGGHLVEETGRDRYQFHDLVRVYAAERALADESEPDQVAAIRRLLTWYLHMADAFERIFNPDHTHLPLDTRPSSHGPLPFTTHLQAWHWAESELANLVPVLRQVTRAGDDVLAWQLPAAVTIIFDLMGQWSDLIPPLSSALAITRTLRDRTAEARILIHLAEAHENVRQLDEAIEYCQGAFSIYAAIDDWNGQWSALQLEGITCLFLGRFSEAIDRLQQALATARQASDLRTEGMSLTWLGAVHERLAAFQTATGLREQAVAALKQARNRWQYAYALWQLADSYHHDGRTSDAVDSYRKAQSIFREIGDRRDEAVVLYQLGNAQKTAGQNDAARQSWQQALTIFEELRDTRANQVRAKLGTER
jgi:tetratricopeptide (TPR) repeat protein